MSTKKYKRALIITATVESSLWLVLRFAAKYVGLFMYQVLTCLSLFMIVSGLVFGIMHSHCKDSEGEVSAEEANESTFSPELVAAEKGGIVFLFVIGSVALVVILYFAYRGAAVVFGL